MKNCGVSLKEFKETVHLTWRDIEDAPPLVEEMIFKHRRGPDVLTPLSKGKDWLLSGLAKRQPKTGNLLLNGSDFFAACNRPITPPRKPGQPPRGNVGLYIEAGKKIVQIGTLPFKSSRSEMVTNMPEEILESYYGTTSLDGLIFPNSDILHPNGRLLPIPARLGWPITEHFLESLGAQRFLPPLVECLSLEEDEDGNHYGLRLFLFRPETKNESDILLLNSQSREIIHLPNGDIAEMRYLVEPATAIDEYCASIIEERDINFSFVPFLGEKLL